MNWETLGGVGQRARVQWHNPARHMAFLPNILVTVEQEAAKDVDS